MANIIRTVIQLRRAHTSEWELHKSVIPAAGEPCFDLDLNTLKIGNGIDTYEDLEPIGGVKLEISADGKSVILEDNVFKIAGFDAAEVGAQPRKSADGKIEWIVPSTETLEGLQSAVAGLKSDVKALQDIVGVTDGGSTTLLDRVGAVESQVQTLNGDATVEGSILKIVKGEIDAFAKDVSDDGKINTIKELVDYVSTHGGETQAILSDVSELKGLVGSSSVQSQIESAIANSGHITKSEAEDTLMSKIAAAATLQHVKYEVSHKPAGTLVDYREKEIRIMCPVGTKFDLQSGGGNPDLYYVGFKAYAPKGAVGFKEDLAEIITDDTMHSFEGNDFAGVDAYGRKYSIIWIPVANHSNGTWEYYGAKSTTSKYLGWHYSVEWYDANGVKIASDCIRINLSNEACHNVVEPYYMANVVKEISVGGTVLDVINNRVEIPAGAGLKSSDEIEIAEDGTIGVKAIGWSKIVQRDGESVVFDGGGAADR